MSSWIVCFALLLVVASQHTVQGQISFTGVLQLGATTVPPEGFSQLLLNNLSPPRPSAFLNRPETRFETISSGGSIIFSGSELAETESGETFSMVNIFQTLIENSPNAYTFEEFSTGTIFDTGPGRLLISGGIAIYSNATRFSDGINSLLSIIPPPRIPPPQVGVMVVRRADELILNIDPTPDVTASTTDDVIELTGARSFMVNSGETVQYSGNTVFVRRGAITRQETLSTGIATFSVLQDVFQNGQFGTRFTQFMNDAPGIFNGPGVLSVGDLSGTNVAFFSSSASSNELISNSVIDMQLSFDPDTGTSTVRINDIFLNSAIPRQLVAVNRDTRDFSFPTANRIEYNNGNIQVFNANGQRLGNFQNFDLTAFSNGELLRFGRSAGMGIMQTGTVTLADGEMGFRMFFSRDGQAFSYPNTNRVISDRISTALSMVSFTPRPFPAFFTNSDNSGAAILSIDPSGGNQQVDVVTVTDRPAVLVGSGQLIQYNGGTLRVYDRSDPSTNIFRADGINSLTSFEREPFMLFYEVFDSSNSLNRDIAGPGVIYYDSQGRAFFTNDNGISSFISSFIISLPPATINTQTVTVNGSRIVNIVNGDEVLVEGSTSTTTDVTTGQGVIYTDNTVRTVNGFPVADDSTVEVGNNGDGTFTLTVRTAGGMVLDSVVVNGVFYLNGTAITTNTTLAGGGVLYFDGSGQVAYSPDRSASSSLVTDLANLGFPFLSIVGNITELSFFDGRRVNQFIGTSTSFLPGPGTIFSSGSQALFSTDLVRNRQIGGEISRLFPVNVTVSTITGGVMIISGTTDEIIYSITIGNFRTRTISGTGSGIYSGGVLRLPGMNITTSRIILFNGFETRIFGSGDTVTIPGPFEVYINELTGEVFITTDPTTARRIREGIRSASFNFRTPILVRPSETILISKFAEVPAFFGQSVTVYEGATLMLRCRLTQGAPIPAFLLTQDGTEIDESLDDRINITMVSDFETVLVIAEVSPDDAGRYGCRVSNEIGQDRAFTDLRVRPGVAPVINNNFFPLIDNGGLTITATNEVPIRIEEVLVADRSPGVLPTTDPSFVTTINLACKADGLPRPAIEWSAMSGGVAVPINESNVMVLRPGRSIYTVDIDGSNTSSITYTCMAIGSMDVEASVRVDLISYSCEVSTENGPCSESCGVGLQAFSPDDCFVRRNELVPVRVDQIPPQLNITEFGFCFPPDSCPVVTFEFDDSIMFGNCSVPCGGGTQNRINVCYRVVDGIRQEQVDVQECLNEGLIAPATIRDCNDDRCPRWVVTSPFGQCSSTCAGGTQMRTVVCMQEIARINATTMEAIRVDGRIVRDDSIVDDGECRAGQMPIRMQNCNEQIPCPHRWQPNPWGPCSADFCQERSLSCVQFDSTGDVWVIDDVNCANLARPHVFRSCAGGQCIRGDWRATPWSPCSVSCGIGVRTRSVTCELMDGTEIFPTFCDPATQPASSGRCILFNCPGRCDYEPSICSDVVKWFGCKRFPSREIAEQCCRTCPTIARPIVLPPLITPESLVLNFDQDIYRVPEGTDAEVCCVATSSTTPGAFLNFETPCTFTYEPDMMNERNSTVNIGNVIDNRACAILESSDLAQGTVFEVTLDGDGNLDLPSMVVNVTIV